MMNRRYILHLCLLIIPMVISGQTNNFTTQLDATYATYKSDGFDQKRIKHQQVLDLIEGLKQHKLIQLKVVGRSIEGRSLNLISLGTGPVHIFLWSQMHGDEPTATQAIFDMLNFFNGQGFEVEKRTMLEATTIHFLPMLNPDGAERFQRRNALGIDINRDALMLQSPEGSVLKRVRDSLNADFGFNLHDQSRYYNAERTAKPATISFLAPAYNYEKEINTVRGNAMKVIVYMNSIIQTVAPGQVGKYNDDFEPRAFGDNIQKWGTSTILIESGGNYDDVEKQGIRRLNYVAILSSLYAIATEEYKKMTLSDYEAIPENDSKLFDLKITGLRYPLNGKIYTVDLGIKRNEIDKEGNDTFYFKSAITDQGDLSTYYGYKTVDVSEYQLVNAKVDTKHYDSMADITAEEGWKLLQKGIGYVRVAKDRIPPRHTEFLVPVPQDFKPSELSLRPGVNATFFLAKNGKLHLALINGFLIDLGNPAAFMTKHKN